MTSLSRFGYFLKEDVIRHSDKNMTDWLSGRFLELGIDHTLSGLEIQVSQKGLDSIESNKEELIGMLKKVEESKDKKEIPEQFYDPDLLEKILVELDKDHKLDTKAKLALFVIRLTAELRNDKERCSGALKGNSSSGKDNAINTTLKHFPDEDNFFLTRGTSAAIEDEANKVKCIAFSEINKHRENGANSELTETFKQLSEGGAFILKKDPATGYKTTKKVEAKQLCLLYGTTEYQSDDELETRYVIIPIEASQTKNRVVVDSICDNVSNISALDKCESWIKKGIKCLDNNLDVVIPYASLLKGKILDVDGKEKFFFNYKKERIKRDAKRIFNLTKAITWLYQKQRNILENEGHRILVSEPSDFLTAIDIFAGFFNLTYSGIDHRLESCFKKINALAGKHDAEIIKDGFDYAYSGWVFRHKLQEELGINSVNTIKAYIKELKDLTLVQTHYDPAHPRGYLIKGCQEGINSLSMPISMTALDTLLTGYLTPENLDKWYSNKRILPIKLNFSVSKSEIDTLKIDTLNLQESTHTKGGQINET